MEKVIEKLKRLFILTGAFLLLLSVAAHAQPLVAKKALTIRFIPVLTVETEKDGYAEGDTAYSSGVTFRRAYRILSAQE